MEQCRIHLKYQLVFLPEEMAALILSRSSPHPDVESPVNGLLNHRNMKMNVLECQLVFLELPKKRSLKKWWWHGWKVQRFYIQSFMSSCASIRSGNNKNRQDETVLTTQFFYESCPLNPGLCIEEVNRSISKKIINTSNV